MVVFKLPMSSENSALCVQSRAARGGLWVLGLVCEEEMRHKLLLVGINFKSNMMNYKLCV